MTNSAIQETEVSKLDCGDRRIHHWATRLAARIREAGITTSGVDCSRTKYGYRSAYFAVKGIGEVRVSDHPMSGRQASDVSISSPVSYTDLLKAYVFYHNRHHPVQLVVVNDPPTIMEQSAAALHVAEKARKAEEKAMARKTNARIETERQAFWRAAVAASGIEGSYKEVKFQLQAMGVRHRPEITTQGASA